MIERAEIARTPLLLAMGLGGLLAAAVLLDPTPQMALVCIGAGFFILAFFNRHAALYIIVLAMALSPEIPVLGVPVRIDDLLMIPLVAGWLAHLCVSREREGNPLSRLMVAYFLVGVVATAWGTFLGTANILSTDRGDSALFHLLKRLEFVLVAFILVDTLRTPKEAQRLTYVLIAAMVGMNVLSLQQFLESHFAAIPPTGVTGHDEIELVSASQRAREVGVAAMIAVPLALSLVPACRPPAKALLTAITLFSIAVLPLSLGRNFLAVTLLILLYVGLIQRQRWVLILPVLLFLGLHFYPSHVTERVLSIEHLVKPDIAGRIDEPGALIIERARAPIRYAALAIGNSPVLGFGLASVPLGFIDNEYSAQLFYSGLVGLTVFLVLGVRAMALARQAAAAAQDPVTVGIVRGFQLVLVAYAAFSVFATSISPTHTGGFFFIILALIAVLHRSVARADGSSDMSVRSRAV